jgi:hypothetical protein
MACLGIYLYEAMKRDECTLPLWSFSIGDDAGRTHIAADEFSKGMMRGERAFRLWSLAMKRDERTLQLRGFR